MGLTRRFTEPAVLLDQAAGWPGRLGRGVVVRRPGAQGQGACRIEGVRFLAADQLERDGRLTATDLARLALFE